MNGPSIHNGNLSITGSLSVGGNISIKDGSIGEDQLAEGEDFSASKFTHRLECHIKASVPDVAVAAFSEVFYYARAAASVLFGNILVQIAPTGNDREVTLDIQKGNASDAYASILTAPVVIDDGVTPREPTPFVFDPAKIDLVAEDSLMLVITVAGAAGNQAKGIDVFITIDQTPQ